MIIGHQKQWQFLRKLAEISRIPHAFLFSGQNQLGKKTLAIEFIKLLNCQNPSFEARPCQSCRSCEDIQKRVHPDLSIIKPERNEIQISQIRDLSWRLSLKPYSAPFKTAIIDEAHLMNQEAQSAFLKTLEEPKGQTLLILITEYPEMLFPTILSRTERLKFYPVSFSEIENYLKSQGLTKGLCAKLASSSFGRPGVAVKFLLDPQKLESQKQRISDLIKISNSDFGPRFQYVKDLSQDPQNLKEILDIWLRYFRDILLARLSSKKQNQREQFSLMGNYSITKLKNILRLIQRTNYLISKTNINSRLALEVLMLEL